MTATELARLLDSKTNDDQVTRMLSSEKLTVKNMVETDQTADAKNWTKR